MSGTKITNFEAAANDLVTAMFKEADPTKPNALKMGIVPFSMTVNVGSANATQSWLDKDAKASYHSAIFVSPANRLTLFSQMRIPWGGCVESRPLPYDVQDTPPSITMPDTLFVPYFAPDESDRDYYAINDDMNDDTTTSSVMKHRTRQGQVAKYSKDAILQRDRISSNIPYLYGPNSGFELQPITRLTTSQTTLTNAINAMTVVGDTNIPMGLVWSWHLRSPNAPFAAGVPYTSKDTRKIRGPEVTWPVLATNGKEIILPGGVACPAT